MLIYHKRHALVEVQCPCVNVPIHQLKSGLFDKLMVFS